ncbi:unnamed protein product [Paramecium sonneborni]|uniref:Dynamin N-terminal domain-containing protein n=1 Tax=Paramecium sonneborni TaxID=65129 RepID=A0A8S1R804_9CILI|nr:unnamed protein product [Paramecium sonneborni]
MNLLKKIFYREQPKQTESQFFSPMNEKIEEFQKKLNVLPYEHSQYVNEIIQQINSQLKDLRDYVQSTKFYVSKVFIFYIVFLGTTSAGKSTFINSLLGQQILPSRNQECTQSMILISYNERILLNDQVINSLDQAQSLLLEMQQNQKFEIVNLQVPSLFHQQLPLDLRSRIVFVDTPGIKISEQKIYENHFQLIDEQLIGNNHRINLWISNYTTFDNDKELQNQIIKIFTPKAQSQRLNNQNSSLSDIIVEDFQEIQKQQLLASTNNSQESNEQLLISNKSQIATLFFILNKYDEKKGSEDKNIDLILKEISDIIGSQNNIFKISALRAMRYRILNYGNKQAIDKLIQSYFIDFRDIEQFITIDDCKKYCDQKIKNNPNLLQNQDYERFNNQLTQSIKKEICEAFYGDIYIQITQSLIFLEFVINSQYINMETQLYENLEEVINNFIDLQINHYFDWINIFKQDALNQITVNFKYNIPKSSEDRQKMIISTCTSALKTLIELEIKILKLNENIKNAIIKKIESIFSQQKINDLNLSVQNTREKDLPIIEGCLQLFKILCDNKILEISKQSFEQYSENVKKTVGVRINPIQQNAGYISTGLSIIALLGRRFAFKSVMSSPIFAAIGFGLMSFNFNFIFTQSWYSEDIILSQLTQLESQLILQINDLENNHRRINQKTATSIKNFLRSLTSI